MDFKSWPKKWNDATLRQYAPLPEYPQSRPWPLIGMLAVGLVAGAAIGGYTVSQRSQMKRLSVYAHRMGDELASMAREEKVAPAASNHRRKAASEV